MTGDEKPHEHSNCVHVDTGRTNTRTTIAAALAMIQTWPVILTVDDAPPVPRCCDGHSLCDRCQAIKDMSDSLPRARRAKHRGSSILELMVGLGAKDQGAP